MRLSPWPTALLLCLAELSAASRLAAAPTPPALPPELVRHALGLLPPLLAVSECGHNVSIWQGGDGVHPWRTLVHDGVVEEVRFFPIGGRLLARGTNNVVIWDAWTGRVVQALPKSTLLFDAQIFPDGNRLATLAADGSATVWSVASGAALWRTDARGVAWQHRPMRLVPGGDWILTGVSALRADLAAVWRAGAGRAVAHTAGEAIVDLVASPCGGVVGLVGRACVTLWRPRAVAPVLCGQAEEAAEGAPMHMGLSEGGRRVATSADQRILIWDGITGELLRTIDTGSAISALALLPDGGRAVTISSSRSVVWDAASGRRLHVFDGAAGEFNSRIVASRDGGVVAAFGEARLVLPGWRPPRHLDDFDTAWDDEWPPRVWEEWLPGGLAVSAALGARPRRRRFSEVMRQSRISILDVSAGRVVRKQEGPEWQMWRGSVTPWPCSVAIAPVAPHLFG